MCVSLVWKVCLYKLLLCVGHRAGSISGVALVFTASIGGTIRIPGAVSCLASFYARAHRKPGLGPWEQRKGEPGVPLPCGLLQACSWLSPPLHQAWSQEHCAHCPDGQSESARGHIVSGRQALNANTSPVPCALLLLKFPPRQWRERKPAGPLVSFCLLRPSCSLLSPWHLDSGAASAAGLGVRAWDILSDTVATVFVAQMGKLKAREGMLQQTESFPEAGLPVQPPAASCPPARSRLRQQQGAQAGCSETSNLPLLQGSRSGPLGWSGGAAGSCPGWGGPCRDLLPWGFGADLGLSSLSGWAGDVSVVSVRLFLC